ncbi:MAG: hypothetical protein Aurels2KO_35550 [Aureliella sp.]
MDFQLPEDFFVDHLATNFPSGDVAIILEAAVVEAAGDLAVVSSEELDLEEYARLGHCQLSRMDSPRPVVTKRWGGEDFDRIFESVRQAIWRVECEGGQTLTCVETSWATSCGLEHRYWIVAERTEEADAFLLDVFRKTNAPGESILVFQDGYWQRSESLYRAVQQASFDDLVLEPSVRDTLRDDFRWFLNAREQYADLGLSWRRGVLLLGPPGNGKTHCIRALVKELGVPCLYVQSLSHPYYSPEQTLARVFSRARRLRPCLVILEDLDSLIDDENRSYFLNQLDGFDQNEGLMVLATTNHPERIDAAIIDRPSRFDRKYHFSLPSPDLRREFLRKWQDKLANRIDWPDGMLETAVEHTEGFSFAYLKELVTSCLLSYLADKEQNFEEVLVATCKLLGDQMASSPPPPPPGERRPPGRPPRRDRRCR